jgi:hypothetical protein
MRLDQPHKGIRPLAFAAPVDRVPPSTDIAISSIPGITPCRQGISVAGFVTPLAKWF